MLKGAGVALASERRAVDPSPATLAHPQKSRERDPASATPEGLGAIRAASKLDETALPRRGLDTILLGLTFSVTGAPGDQAEPVTHDLLATAPPAGGTGAGVGRLAQARVLCPGPGGGGAARPGLAGQGWVPTWPVRGPRGGAGLHLRPARAPSPSPGCHLSSGGVSFGQLSPIPQPSFGDLLLGKELEGHQLDGERPPRGRRGSSRHRAEPPPAGECGRLRAGGRGGGAALGSRGPTSQILITPTFSRPAPIP